MSPTRGGGRDPRTSQGAKLELAWPWTPAAKSRSGSALGRSPPQKRQLPRPKSKSRPPSTPSALVLVSESSAEPTLAWAL